MKNQISSRVDYLYQLTVLEDSVNQVEKLHSSLKTAACFQIFSSTFIFVFSKFNFFTIVPSSSVSTTSIYLSLQFFIYIICMIDNTMLSLTSIFVLCISVNHRVGLKDFICYSFINFLFSSGFLAVDNICFFSFFLNDDKYSFKIF